MVGYSGRISIDLISIFEEWIRDEIRVIVGFFGPVHARAVLCQVNTCMEYWWPSVGRK